MGLKEVQEYATKLKKVEKMKEIREQVDTLPVPQTHPYVHGYKMAQVQQFIR